MKLKISLLAVMLLLSSAVAMSQTSPEPAVQNFTQNQVCFPIPSCPNISSMANPPSITDVSVINPFSSFNESILQVSAKVQSLESKINILTIAALVNIILSIFLIVYLIKIARKPS